MCYSQSGAARTRWWGTPNANHVDARRQERREIERALLEGQLWGVAATNAMELGVDIGSLDVTLHLGFPGSIASLWQQVGGLTSLMLQRRRAVA